MQAQQQHLASGPAWTAACCPAAAIDAAFSAVTELCQKRSAAAPGVDLRLRVGLLLGGGGSIVALSVACGDYRFSRLAPGVGLRLGGLCQGSRLLLGGGRRIGLALPVGLQRSLKISVLLLPQPPVEVLERKLDSIRDRIHGDQVQRLTASASRCRSASRERWNLASCSSRSRR